MNHPDRTQPLNAFTVDVEDYFHVSAFADRISPDDWDTFECRVEANTHRLLDQAARHGVRGTFFVLGWVADRYPDLVLDIQAAGHEIGCHSYAHQLLYDLGPDRFRADLVRARDLLEQIVGTPVTLYRAPSFSITPRSLWAFEILADEGFTVDSSVYPVRHDRYGMPDAPPGPWTERTSCGPVVEFPGTVCRLGSWNVPIGGGGYFRLCPWPVMRRLLARSTAQRPLNFYIHPWEVDPDQPRVAASLRSRFRHYQNLRTTTSKLDQLLRHFAFAPMSDVLRQQGLLPEETHLPEVVQPTGADPS